MRRQVGAEDPADVEVLVADRRMDVVPRRVVRIRRRVLRIEARVARGAGHADEERRLPRLAREQVLELAHADDAGGRAMVRLDLRVVGTAVVVMRRRVARRTVGIVHHAPIVEAGVTIRREHRFEPERQVERRARQDEAEHLLAAERRLEPGLATCALGLTQPIGLLLISASGRHPQHPRSDRDQAESPHRSLPSGAVTGTREIPTRVARNHQDVGINI